MTELKDIILRDIAANGPMNVAQFMQTCLLHPTLGYYTNATVFGAQGDFITAPEISQMFGEMVGLALGQTWLDQGSPQAFHLVELGPGRGTLMADILRATKGVDGFHQAMTLSLYEASDRLAAQQKTALTGYQVNWITDLSSLSPAPLFLIANEFFDALPIRQFQRMPDGWHERVIGTSQGALQFGLAGPVTTHPYLEQRMTDTDIGHIVEMCPQIETYADTIGAHIEQHGGAAFIIDYGDWRSNGDTMQALYQHQYCDPLEHLGQADLTAHVDFERLAHAAPCAASKPTPQGVWLERLGITHRAQSLAQRLSGAALENHISAHRRLTHPDEMGRLFKVLALYPTHQPCPVGVES